MTEFENRDLLCWIYQNQGKCRYGVKCQWLHLDRDSPTVYSNNNNNNSKNVYKNEKRLSANDILSKNAAEQKRLIGEKLFPAVEEHEPRLAAKITGMLLEGMDNKDLLLLICHPSLVSYMCQKSIQIIKNHRIKKQIDNKNNKISESDQEMENNNVNKMGKFEEINLNIINCPICTFHNDINAVQCEMCETKLKQKQKVNLIKNKQNKMVPNMDNIEKVNTGIIENVKKRQTLSDDVTEDSEPLPKRRKLNESDDDDDDVLDGLRGKESLLKMCRFVREDHIEELTVRYCPGCNFTNRHDAQSCVQCNLNWIFK